MNRNWLFIFCVILSSCSPVKLDEQLEGQLTNEIRIEALPERIANVLQAELQGRRLSSTENAAWQIMHGVICYGHDLPLDTPDRGTLPALDYAFQEGVIRGWQLMPGQNLADGRRGVKAHLEAGSYTGQGHVDQWIAICAMAELPATDRVVIDGEAHTLLDWAEQARVDACYNPLNEFSWSLIALTYYFPNDYQWTTNDGSIWSWERMLEFEVAYDLNDSACGGAHRLVGLTRALAAKQRLKLPDSPTWDATRRKVDQALIDIEQMRCRDGSLSSHYLERPGASRDLGLTLASTGHLFEFLSIAADDKTLQSDWVKAAASRLCEIFEVTRGEDLDCGACYHALNGLKVYRQRVVGASTKTSDVKTSSGKVEDAKSE